MTFDPQLDAAPAPPPAYEANPFGDLAIASKNYWAARTGREYPPAPTFRIVNGKQKLGRYMDPFGCQGHMRSAKTLWEKWYTGFFISGGIGLLFMEIDWVFFLVALPLMGAWYFGVKAKHRHQYDLYYGIQEEIIRTGEPQWVPYDKERLKLLDSDPRAVWP
jgi:hypothetical protein